MYKTPFTYKHYKSYQKLERIVCNSKKKILNIEIFDLHRYIHYLNRNAMGLTSYLSNNLPSHIYEILRTYSMSFKKYRSRLFNKYKEKFLWLKQKSEINLAKQIKPIKYSCRLHKNSDNNQNNSTYIYRKTLKNPEVPQIYINIDPNKFNSNDSNPLDHVCIAESYRRKRSSVVAK